MKNSYLYSLSMRLGLVLLFSAYSLLCFSQFGGGRGTEDDPWQVSRPEHLNSIRNHLGSYFIQTGDIDLDLAPWNEGEGWNPIGTSTIGNHFSGNYDGDGFVISGLTIDRPNGSYQGLFGFTDGAVIENLGVIDVEIISRGDAGGLVGRSRRTTVENCFTTGNVSGSWNLVGGLSGVNQNDSQVINCFSFVNVTGGTRAGGLVGSNHSGGAIINSYARGNVRGTNQVGGLVGHSYAGCNITNSYSTGNVNGDGVFTGGLIGENRGDVTESYWNIQTSNQEQSAGGSGRSTQQMVFPYDGETYVRWDFEEIWVNDERRENNDGYPYLFHQDFDAGVAINPPHVMIEVIISEDEERVLITWDAVENANSYIIYATFDPYSEDWGEPIAIVSQREFSEPFSVRRKKFYYVTASTDEAP